jgi:hypothetical protein
MTFKLDTNELAKLCGLSKSGLQKRMKRLNVKRKCFPSLVRFLFPILLEQSNKGIDPRQIYREILKDRAARKSELSVEKRMAMFKNVQKPAIDSLYQSVDFDFNQE